MSSLKQQCSIGVFVLMWLLIFVIPSGYYYMRNMNQGSDAFLKVTVNKLSVKVSEHKTSFDKAITDIGKKLDSAITSLDSKIKDLHSSISKRQQKTKQQINELQESSEDSENHTKGEIRQGGLCMDSMERSHDGMIELFECHGEGRNQHWKFTKDGAVINKGNCLSASEEGEVGFVKLKFCSSQEPNQKWERRNSQLKLYGSERCLDVHVDDKSLVTAKCDTSKKRQQWTFT